LEWFIFSRDYNEILTTRSEIAVFCFVSERVELQPVNTCKAHTPMLSKMLPSFGCNQQKQVEKSEILSSERQAAVAASAVVAPKTVVTHCNPVILVLGHRLQLHRCCSNPEQKVVLFPNNETKKYQKSQPQNQKTRERE